jgi:hypothetical protein
MQVETGTPLARKRRATATLPHSHTGMSMPTPIAGTIERIEFLGTKRRRASSLTKTCTMAETTTPSNRKGVASTKIPRKMLIQSWICGAIAFAFSARRCVLTDPSIPGQSCRAVSASLRSCRSCRVISVPAHTPRPPFRRAACDGRGYRRSKERSSRSLPRREHRKWRSSAGHHRPCGRRRS